METPRISSQKEIQESTPCTKGNAHSILGLKGPILQRNLETGSTVNSPKLQRDAVQQTEASNSIQMLRPIVGRSAFIT